MEGALPNKTFCSEEEQQEEKTHSSHVHILHNHVVQDHLHHYNQLKEHLTGGVSQEICKCQLEEMLLGDEEEARHEKMKAKIEERKRRAAEERKGVSDTATLNYDIDQVLLFIGGETESSKRSCLRRGGTKYSDKKRRNTPKAERFNNIGNIDSDDESVESMEVGNSCAVEDEESFFQHCHKTDEDWTEVNMRKKKKTSKKPEKMPHLFTIEDLSHNVCHGNTAPVDNPRCPAEKERLGKGEAWETCLFSAGESRKLLSEEDFPSLQSCGWHRKEKKVVEEEVLVSTGDQIDGDEADAEEETDEEIGQEEGVKEECGEEEPEKCEQMTRSCCLRNMFQFPGTLCFCFCDSTVSISVEEKEEPKIGLTRMHAMLSGLVVPFGKF